MHGAGAVVFFFCRLQRVRRLHELREEKRVRRGEAPEKIVAGDGATRRASGFRVRHVHVPHNLREQSGVRQRRAVAHLPVRGREPLDGGGQALRGEPHRLRCELFVREDEAQHVKRVHLGNVHALARAASHLAAADVLAVVVRQVQQFLERFVQQSSWNASGFREEHRHEPERYARGSANQVPDILFRPRRSLEERRQPLARLPTEPRVAGSKQRFPETRQADERLLDSAVVLQGEQRGEQSVPRVAKLRVVEQSVARVRKGASVELHAAREFANHERNLLHRQPARGDNHLRARRELGAF
mmetsp:Transcript_14658/g.61870  ORF Transcript_14658/g.61870 Transcript_14658/m.61870 type:complete len:301 (+) Transcript_14658:2636-3538(+)